MHGFGEFSFGFGGYDFEDDVLGADDSSAYMARVRGAVTTHRGIGGGFDVKFLVPRDNFYEQTINSTDAIQSDFYGHFLVTMAAADRFRMPLRIGPYFSQVRAEFEVSSDVTRYDSLGFRVEIEPEVLLFGRGRGQASAFARFSAGLHDSSIDDESTNRHYHSYGHTLGFESGFRFAIGPMAFSAAYVYHENRIAESDRENGLVIPQLETDFQGVLFGLGGRF